ncbi:MAG TPA: LptE family protein [Candidatus Tectomicrobia bacterium]|nr:LptE family protein [Candidatus Tectomicrobia bacterium]
MTVARARGVLLLALAAAAGGCGYSLRGTLPPHIRTIAVPVFANHTQQPAVEALITRAVVEAFSTNGRLRVVRREEADAVLEGAITGYDVTSIAFDREANISQYRLVVTLSLRMRDLRRDAVLFEETHLREQADFRVAGPVSLTIGREETALAQAAADIARAVVAVSVDPF